MKKLLTSCFGLGFLPIAPGTWGSLPPAIVFAGMCFFGASALAISLVMVIIAIIFSFICVTYAPAAIKATGNDDPGQVVADEVAGQAVTFIAASAVGTQSIVIAALTGFLAFRFFDILKPPPCRKLEKLPAGWGILADDIAAGIYAAIFLQICIRFLF